MTIKKFLTATAAVATLTLSGISAASADGWNDRGGYQDNRGYDGRDYRDGNRDAYGYRGDDRGYWYFDRWEHRWRFHRNVYWGAPFSFHLRLGGDGYDRH